VKPIGGIGQRRRLGARGSPGLGSPPHSPRRLHLCLIDLPSTNSPCAGWFSPQLQTNDACFEKSFCRQYTCTGYNTRYCAVALFLSYINYAILPDQQAIRQAMSAPGTFCFSAVLHHFFCSGQTSVSLPIMHAHWLLHSFAQWVRGCSPPI